MPETEGVRGRRNFIWGICLGLGLGIGLCLLAAFLLTLRGVTVYVKAGPLARALSYEAQERLKANLPALLGEARGQVPELVRPELRRRLSGATIEFYGVSIAVPPESLGGLETYLVGLVEQTVGRVLEGMGARLVAGDGKIPLEALLEAALREGLDGQTFMLKLPGRLSIPVTVILE